MSSSSLQRRSSKTKLRASTEVALVYDLHGGVQNDIKAMVDRLCADIERPDLVGPLFIVTFELAVNALKAVYKNLYLEHFVKELGLDNVSYEAWLSLFKTEIETHKGRFFSDLTREKRLGVKVYLQRRESSATIMVVNQGSPSDLEFDRIMRSIKNARQLKQLSVLLEDDTRDRHGEGAGLGIPLIVMTLRGMGLTPDNLNFHVKNDKTIVSFTIPLSGKNEIGNTEVLPEVITDANLAQEYFQRMDLCVLQFDIQGNLRAVSPAFLRKMGLEKSEANKCNGLIPQKFIDDIFRGPRSIRLIERFENYHLQLASADGKSDLVFNISGFMDSQMRVYTFWSIVFAHGESPRSESNLVENMQVNNIARQYIPAIVIQKAEENVRLGRREIVSEVREATIMFTDIVDFTKISRQSKPEEVVDLLNNALTIATRLVLKHGGYVDKFMGDSIFAIFENPLPAVVAAVEIQNTFQEMNDVRALDEKAPVYLRIGVHTGTVILGNVGTRERMDWTAIGDVVNQTARIERACKPGQVVISSDTYDRISAHISYTSVTELKSRNKVSERLYFVRSVAFSYKDAKLTVSLREKAPDGEEKPVRQD
ncbi:MAG: adenylate/guanylate cyclase domain-containing protein [Spirochaetia bacterium]|nr:adenylate/guanylate cyclase domain-containing protein [Spirochaetia bacterium]